MTPEQEERQVKALERIADALGARVAAADNQTAVALTALQSVADERDAALRRATTAEQLLSAAKEPAPVEGKEIGQ